MNKLGDAEDKDTFDDYVLENEQDVGRGSSPSKNRKIVLVSGSLFFIMSVTTSFMLLLSLPWLL